MPLVHRHPCKKDALDNTTLATTKGQGGKRGREGGKTSRDRKGLLLSMVNDKLHVGRADLGRDLVGAAHRNR